MHSASTPHRSITASAIYALLNPIPFGFFVAALVFDTIYARGGELLWDKGAAWLLAIGLVIAIVPRLINLVQVWGPSRYRALHSDRLDFWLNLLAVVLAIVNSFVHSRDAYAVVPTGVWLSVCTVVLLALGNVLVSVGNSMAGSALNA